MKKFKKGKQIKNLNTLMEQEFIYFRDKVQHRGWFQNWQLVRVMQYLKSGVLYIAEEIKESGD